MIQSNEFIQRLRRAVLKTWPQNLYESNSPTLKRFAEKLSCCFSFKFLTASLLYIPCTDWLYASFCAWSWLQHFLRTFLYFVHFELRTLCLVHCVGFINQQDRVNIWKLITSAAGSTVIPHCRKNFDQKL